MIRQDDTRANDKGRKSSLHFQSLGIRTKASLILLMSVACVVLLDMAAVLANISGISGRLHDRFAWLAMLSVPVIPILLIIGTVLGMLDWHAARKASRPVNRLTIIAACLNLASLVIVVLLVVVLLGRSGCAAGVGSGFWRFEPCGLGSL